MENHRDLPEELIFEILSRLPVESLLRFQIVCKSWRRLINQPKFVSKHLLHSLLHTHTHTHTDASNSSTILLRRSVDNQSGIEDNIFSLLTYPLLDNPSAVDIDLPCLKDYSSLEICGHSHGIVCISDILGEEIFLCNPATRELRRLPPSIILLTEFPDDFTFCTGGVGFGYDPKSNDFKVVRIVKFMDARNLLPSRAEVYDLSTDSWREIETPVPVETFWSPSFLMYYRGIYYWWGFCAQESKEVIQSFDMSDEVFGMIPVPESFERRLENYRCMGVWKGSIVLFHYPFIGDTKHFDLWMMGNDDSGRISWSKVLRIGPISGLERPLLIVNSEEVIMEAELGKVVVYNLTPMN